LSGTGGIVKKIKNLLFYLGGAGGVYGGHSYMSTWNSYMKVAWTNLGDKQPGIKNPTAPTTHKKTPHEINQAGFMFLN